MEQHNSGVARQAGVTLIELMVSLVIIAILSAAALPAYNDYVKRGKIPQATSNLSSMRVKMEQYFQDNRSYPSACTAAAGMPLPAADDFTYSCTLTATTFTVQAQGSGSMSDFIYTIDESNNKRTTKLPPAWGSASAASPIGCWVRKKGGAC
ncbi:prepilin-type N-terminal cleavage/methylation domain-containing protein [Pseudoduganella eburnea]|uniref:Prepilin-type N-terminal cleavage/methylation domain-containing protein n=1 Tax=Massilia eburnea TaxID=1776165 RepID=A0A6L6QKL0_9BURK|nr:type IV pilin protein [Massilia eburnea]MTW12819.1 prepilin-type N-terminal cleavage/methylation domain-containing protein [Massilia eburnea]